MKNTLVVVMTAFALAACSWGIKLDSAGRNVRTSWNGDVTSCTEVGKVTVSVLDHVGPVDRSRLTVSDELEVMARNEAAGLGADTVKPLGPPHQGEQHWAAYRCGPAAASRRPPPRVEQRNQDGSVETFPIKHR